LIADDLPEHFSVELKDENVQIIVEGREEETNEEDENGDRTTPAADNDNKMEDEKCPEADAGDMNSSTSELTGMLKLPGVAQPVTNCCAVCLGSYSVGNEVVWSSNSKCAHAFHQECILEWLIKMQPETPCPCCRQEFTDLETIREERRIKWSGDAFNMSNVRL
jgi:hypothetical protein